MTEQSSAFITPKGIKLHVITTKAEHDYIKQLYHDFFMRSIGEDATQEIDDQYFFEIVQISE